MPKIQKFQTPTNSGIQYSPLSPAQAYAKMSTNYFDKTIASSLLLPKKNSLFKDGMLNLGALSNTTGLSLTTPSMNESVSAALTADPVSSAAKESGTGFLGKLTGKSVGDFGKANADMIGQAPQAIEAGMKLIGAKEATTASGGEQLFSQATSAAFKGALKTGNPLAIGITGALKGLDMLNRYAGSTAKKQGTTGLDTGGYTSQISANAGAKQTVLGSIGWKGKGSSKTASFNKQTAAADKSNLLAGNASYKNSQNLLAASNTYGDIATKNQQQLSGGINPNILSVKKGGKINPKVFSNIKKKAQAKITKAQEGGLIPVQRKNIHTGAILPSRTVSNDVESPFLLNENLPPLATLGISLFDPTGITSWGDVKTAWNDGKFTYDDILQPAGAIPLLGKLAKGSEFAKAKQLLSEGKWVNTSKKMGPRRTKSSFDQKYVSPYSARDIAAARRVVKTNKLIDAGQVGVRLGGDIGTADEVKKNIVNYIKTNQIPVKTASALNHSIKPVELALGGSVNVIPEGALHAHKNHFEEDIAKQVTSKGIPVITYEEGNKIVQHAEIERNEVIFHLDTTRKFEKMFETYIACEDAKQKVSLEIECGKLLAEELLENTIDNTGLLEEVN